MKKLYEIPLNEEMVQKSDIVSPNASAKAGQVADAKATYDAFNAKADKTDLDSYRAIADFAVYSFSEWSIKSVTYGAPDQYYIDGNEIMGWTVWYGPENSPIGTIPNDCSTLTVTVKSSVIVDWDYDNDEPIYAYTTVVCSRSRSKTSDTLLKTSDVDLENYVTKEAIADYATIGRVLYPFATPIIRDNRVLLQPRRVNMISFSGESLVVEIDRIYGEDPVEERWKTLGAYDLVMVATVGDTAPNIGWGTNSVDASFTPRTDAATDMEIKANTRKVFWISEYSPGEFVVSGWEVPA